MKLNDEQVASLEKFALDILGEWPDVSLMDGGDLQEIAEKHKLLVPQIVHAPCNDDDCACAEMCSDSEFARGVTCYRIVDWLVRDAQLRIGADDAGQKSPTCNPNEHDWKEMYYGYKCQRCESFVPFGSEPWAPIDE